MFMVAQFELAAVGVLIVNSHESERERSISLNY